MYCTRTRKKTSLGLDVVSPSWALPGRRRRRERRLEQSSVAGGCSLGGCKVGSEYSGGCQRLVCSFSAIMYTLLKALGYGLRICVYMLLLFAEV